MRPGRFARRRDTRGAGEETGRDIPTLAEVERIAGLSDPALRNLRITQSYHELSRGMALMTGRGANWCTFATWASKQAGQTIRGEDLRRTFDTLVQASPEIAAAVEAAVRCAEGLGRHRHVQAFRRTLHNALDPAAAFDRAAGAVARGNQKVFEEIGREFARFLATVEEDRALGRETIARFCEGLRPGEPPDGQRLLREAFAAYGAARFERDPKARAERLLLANLLIGCHEQARLQPEIAEALDAPLREKKRLKDRLLGLVLPGLWGRVRRLILRRHRQRPALDSVLDRLAEHTSRDARRAITSSLMTLRLPDRVLHLGRDLRGDFPDVLRRITDPDLQALLARIDTTPDSVEGSRARDWASLADRLHYIADLFRTAHEDASLFSAPFTVEQVRALMAGRRPPGPL